MQDSAKLLGFDTSRALNFDLNRALQFTVGRPVDFDSQRALNFDFRRGLPFGVRGVIFRGYVCPVCGAQVYADAKECDECGTAFLVKEGPTMKTEDYIPAPPTGKGSYGRSDSLYRQAEGERGPQFQGSAQPVQFTQPQRQQPPRPAAQPQAFNQKVPQRQATFTCPVCAAQVPVGARACPSCTVQFVFETPPQPPMDSIAVCPACGLKVSSHSDYCTQCGEPISPSARARYQRELEATRRQPSEQAGERRVGAPQKKEPKTQTITWEEYQRKQKGGM